MQQRLMTLRIIWGSMFMSQLVFLGIVLAIGKNMPVAEPAAMHLLYYLAILMLVIVVPVGFFVRRRFYNKGRGDDGLVSPAQYASGNIIFWASCEGVGFAAMVFGMLNRGQGPVLFVAAVAIALLVVSFPTGSDVRWD